MVFILDGQKAHKSQRAAISRIIILLVSSETSKLVLFELLSPSLWIRTRTNYILVSDRIYLNISRQCILTAQAKPVGDRFKTFVLIRDTDDLVTIIASSDYISRYRPVLPVWPKNSRVCLEQLSCQSSTMAMMINTNNTNDHLYVQLVVISSRSFPHSWLITGFETRVARRVPIVEQELSTLSEYLSSPHFLLVFL